MRWLSILRRTSDWTRLREVLIEREYCEWLAPYLSWFRKPLGVLILLGLAALLCGLLVAPHGFVVFAAIAAVILIGCLWPWVGIRGVSCQLRFTSTRTEEGKPVEAELVISNRWPWPVWGLAVEGGFGAEADGSQRPAVAVARIGGWARGYFNWTFTPTMRGRYPQTVPELVTEFPFGLWKARKQIQVLSNVIVWPARFSLPPLALPSGAQSWVGQTSECASGNVGHRTSVREYRFGDSMRQVHWAKTALYDKLVSYEREGQAVTEAHISLDTHPALHQGHGPQASMEWAVRIAASICDTLLRQGVIVFIEADGDRFMSRIHGNSATALLDWFALLGSSDSRSSVPSRRSSSTTRRSSLSIHVTTDRSPNVTGESIVIVLDRTTSACADSPHSGQSWIDLCREVDIPTQVRRGWRQGQRRRRCAV
ncbi:MAG: DUF58 domain-containing protein [Planctomycetota bacterium]